MGVGVKNLGVGMGLGGKVGVGFPTLKCGEDIREENNTALSL